MCGDRCGGRTGTSDYELAAELRQAGPLQLSGLVLGLSRGGFVPRMQFGREPVAIAYLELYGGTAGQPVSAVFELARTLNGPPIVSMPGTLAASGEHYSATAPIPIGTLSPGDYIVRATVEWRGAFHEGGADVEEGRGVGQLPGLNVPTSRDTPNPQGHHRCSEFLEITVGGLLIRSSSDSYGDWSTGS